MTQTPLLVQFTRLILENNFAKSEFSADIYHQNFGIAMGTPFAVTAASAFMYYHLPLYQRFIDGIFVIWDGSRVILLEFLHAINTKDECIKITYEISESKISFSDLHLFRVDGCSTLHYSTFQKPLNKYFRYRISHFTPVATESFYQRRTYALCQKQLSLHSFRETRLLFWKRLRLRGYPAKFLLPIFRIFTPYSRSVLCTTKS